ncbi:MAG: glucuronoxylanase [Deltaproteobacteria bacterium]|nr:glucuronoxylanase [Deltaproteobacteria bacterium]
MQADCVGGTTCVNLADEKQEIKGFGGISHPVWIGDLTAAQRETAFGNGPNQLGFSVLRLFISDNRNDWTRDVDTALRAQEAGAYIFSSPWNPPSGMTVNVNGVKRIDPSKFGEYAQHLTDYYNTMTNAGVDIYAVSIQNEPDYAHDWTEWSPEEILNFSKNYAGDLSFRVMSAESFQYRKQIYDPILNDPAALENIDVFGAHTYGTQVSQMPYPLFKQKGAGKELWMTEVYVPNSNADSSDNWPEALQVATHVHNCLVEGEFQAYVWWYIRRSYSPMKEDGNIGKRGYMMAHYSKWVRPGFIRVDMPKNPVNGVNASAYKSDSDVTIVLVNTGNSPQTLNLSVAGSRVTTYYQTVTSGSKNLSDEGTVSVVDGQFSVSLEAQSVTTLHSAN